MHGLALPQPPAFTDAVFAEQLVFFIVLEREKACVHKQGVEKQREKQTPVEQGT